MQNMYVVNKFLWFFTIWLDKLQRVRFYDRYVTFVKPTLSELNNLGGI